MVRTDIIDGVSVTVIAGAEEGNIAACLESVRWAGEIVVLCSSREDRTLEIAGRYTGKAEYRAFTGYADQKAAALAMATRPWVLSLDADERVTPELAAEIGRGINDTDVDAFRIPRKNHLRGKWIRHAGNWPDYQLRLFRREKATMDERLVHEKFAVDGAIGRLTNPLLHFTNPSIRHMLAKNLDYAYLEAREKARRRRVSIPAAFVRLPYEFCRKYFLAGGFLDGWEGFIVSAVHAINKLQVRLYMWEIQHPGDGAERR